MSKRLNLMFYIFFFGCFSWLFVNVLVKGAGNRVLSVISAVLLLSLIFFALRKYSARIDGMSRKAFKKMMAVIFIVFAALLMFAGYLLRQILIMDLKVVYDSVPDFLDNGILDDFGDYYIVCNNNLGLLLLLGGFFKAVSVFGILPGTEGGLTAAVLFNALMIWLSVWFVFLIAGRLFKSNSRVFGVCALCFFCPVFYLWTPVFYTDTLSMPFVSGAVYLYLVSRETASFREKILLSAAAFLTAFAGFAVKGSVGAVAVALVIHILIENREGLFKSAVIAVSGIFLFLGLYAGYNHWQRTGGIIDFSDEQEIGLPLGLWFLYGSHAPGSYSEDDLQYCLGFEGLRERTRAVNAKILENYRGYSAFGYIEMITEKAALTWGDGKYDADVFLCTPRAVNFTHHIILEGQPLYKPYTYYSQGFHIVSLLLFAVSLFKGIIKKETSPITAAHLSLFGVMLFLNFWESTPRYVINVLPLLLCGAADGLFFIADVFGRLREKVRLGNTTRNII